MVNHANSIRRCEPAVEMNSLYYSQESGCSFNEARDGNGNMGNDSQATSFSQPFYTQISQAPSSTQRRQGVDSRRPPVPPDSKENQSHNVQDIGLPLPANKLLRNTCSDLSAASLNTAECTSNQVTAAFYKHNNAQKVAPVNGTPMCASKMSFHPTSLNDNHWPGGRTPLLNGRYLPRQLTKVSKDQQDILETDNAWQPSKVDWQIRGSIPNAILNEITELADKTRDIDATKANLAPELFAVTEAPDRKTRADHSANSDLSNPGLESSESEGSACSWSPTPRSPAVQEPALPENSSPLQVPQRCITPSSSGNVSTIISAGQTCQEVRHVEAGLSARKDPTSEENPIAGEMAPQAPWASEPIQTAPNTVAAGKDRENSLPVPRSDHCLAPIGEGEYEDSEYSMMCSQKQDANHALPWSSSDRVTPQTQENMTDQEANGKTLVQVHRTPFGQLPSTLAQGPGFCGPRPAFSYATANAMGFDDQEPVSSQCFVPGTMMNGQDKHHELSGLPRTSSHSFKADGSGDKRTEGEDRSDMIHGPKGAEAVDGASKCQPSGQNDALSVSPDRSSQARALKRKHSGDDYGRPETHLPCSSVASSKRLQTTAGFASLDVWRYLNPAQAPSKIARESRREFFRHQRGTTVHACPVLDRERMRDGSSPEKLLELSQEASVEVSACTKPHHITPSPSLPSHVDSGPRGGMEATSLSSVSQQSVYDRYRATYPEYQGDESQFHKACKQISMLHREGKAPHPSLWDDFIFRRHHDYREYLVQVTEGCEDAIPYLQYYSEYVQKPSRMELIVKPSYIIPLGSDSAVGTSVQSPTLAAHTRMTATDERKECVALGSNMQKTSRGTGSKASSRQRLRRPSYELDAHDQDEVEQTQDFSVKQWVATQRVERRLGVASPELGSAELAAGEEDDPQPGLDRPGDMSAFSWPEHVQPSRSEVKEAAAWYDDRHTTFKDYARSFVSLPSEKRQLDGRVEIDEKGCVRLHRHLPTLF